MNHQPADLLLDAVDELTIVHVVTTTLDDGLKHFEKHDGLIKQLRDAIASNLGGSAGGKAPNERIPLDADALTKYEQMEIAIGQRYGELTGNVPGLLPEDNLRGWYLEFTNQYRAGDITNDTFDDELHTMQSWVRVITEKLAPPTVRELVGSSCPECGFAWYDTVLNAAKPATRRAEDKAWNWVDADRKPALTVTYRPDDQGGLTESFAKCGCCNHVWMGAAGIRALAYEIEATMPEEGSVVA